MAKGQGTSDRARFEIQFTLQPKPFSDGSPDMSPPTNCGRLPRVTQVLALAIHFDDMLRRRDAVDYADLARLSCICRERVSQIARLNYLAPDIQVELLYLPPTPTGRYPISETAVRKIANLLSWDDQREQWQRVKKMSLEIPSD